MTEASPQSDAPPVQTPYDIIGGHEGVRRFVDRFYDLMDSDPAYARLRAMHATDLGPMRESLAGWLSAWTGGPHDWFEQNPGKCMMSAHRALGVGADTAEQWVDAMTRAIAECGPDHADLTRLMIERLGLMARAMVPDPQEV